MTEFDSLGKTTDYTLRSFTNQFELYSLFKSKCLFKSKKPWAICNIVTIIRLKEIALMQLIKTDSMIACHFHCSNNVFSKI